MLSQELLKSLADGRWNIVGKRVGLRLGLCSVLLLLNPLLKAGEVELGEKKDAAATVARYKALETLARGLYYLESMYVDPAKVSPDKLAADALQGIVGTLDPHTVYMPVKAFEQLTTDTQGKFGGIGIIVSAERDKLVVVSPIEDTPASRAGIKSGDEILAIDDVQVEKLGLNNATEHMRGEPESTIKLSIRRKGTSNVLEFKLQREIIRVASVRSQDLGSGILYARIASFQDNTFDELSATLKKSPQVKGLILDLRDNPGGLLDQAVRVSDLFIDSGVIVSTVGRNKNDVEREFAHKRDTLSDFPMIVLINGGSASASEIVAGALQDHERALILGTTSFGKGSVQTLVSLPNNSGLKITVARYYTPKDRSIQAKGISPDVLVADNDDVPAEGEALPPKAAHPGKRHRPKESDLKGHIESGDLSDIAHKQGLTESMRAWPDNVRNDRQLVTAYTYMRGWSLFQKPAQRRSAALEPTDSLK